MAVLGINIRTAAAVNPGKDVYNGWSGSRGGFWILDGYLLDFSQASKHCRSIAKQSNPACLPAFTLNWTGSYYASSLNGWLTLSYSAEYLFVVLFFVFFFFFNYSGPRLKTTEGRIFMRGAASAHSNSKRLGSNETSTWNKGEKKKKKKKTKRI